MPEEPRDLAPIDQTIPELPDLDTLLPYPSTLELTSAESTKMQRFQLALIQIGQAAGGALVCPGNQEGVPETSRCPYSAKCELLKAHKAPEGELCPIEREVLLARFYGWCNTINADPKNLREDQRAVVSELVWIDLQEQRCTNILSKGEASRLTQINIKDSNPESGEWLSWERVIHANQILQDTLHTRRRMIMKEWMLTPEQKFKAAKALNRRDVGDDISRKMSLRADKLRSLEIVDADFIEVVDKKTPQSV